MPQLHYANKAAQYNLSSKGLPSANMGGGLSPVRFSTGGTLRAPQVNPHVSDVRYFPLPSPKPVLDTTLASANNFADKLLKATYLLQQKEDNIYASNAVSKTETEMGDILYSRVGEDGEIIPGFMDSRGIESKQTFAKTQATLQRILESNLKDLTPAARQKAAHRATNTYNNAMNRIAAHTSGQIRVAEKDALITEIQTIQAEASKDPVRAFQRLTEAVLKAPDKQTRMNLMANNTAHIIDTITNNGVDAGKNELEIMKDRNGFFNLIKENLDSEVRTNIKSKLIQSNQVLTNKYKKRVEDALEIARSTNVEMQGGIVGGLLRHVATTAPDIAKIFDQTYALYPEDREQAYKDSVAILKQGLVAVTHADGYQGAVDAWNLFINEIGKENIKLPNNAITSEIKTFVEGTLKTIGENAEEDKLNSIKISIYDQLGQIENAEQADLLLKGVIAEADKKGWDSSIVKETLTMTSSLKGKFAGVKKAEDVKIQNTNALKLKIALANSSIKDFEKNIVKAVEAKELGPVKAMQIYNDTLKERKEGKGPNDIGPLKTALRKLYNPKHYIYNPATDSAIPRLSLNDPWGLGNEEKGIEDLLKKQGVTSNKKGALYHTELMVTASAEDYKRWRTIKENRSKDYNAYINEVIKSAPGEQATDEARLLSEVYPDFYTKEAVVDEVEEKEFPQLEVTTGGLTAEPVVMFSPKEQALSALPVEYHEQYADLDAKRLVALQFLLLDIQLKGGDNLLRDWSTAQVKDFLESYMNTQRYLDWVQANTGEFGGYVYP